MTIETIDNFIEDKEIFKSIDGLFGSEMPWYYTPYVGSPTDSSDIIFFIIFMKMENLKLLYRNYITASYIGYPLKLLRARINCYPKSYKIVYN